MAVSRTTTVRVPPRRRDRSIVADLRLGFDTVVRSPLMRLVAIAYVLLAILGFSVTYPFLLAASETFSTEADLATALGVLSAAVTATSFVVSVVLANRVYARFGVTGAALLLPIVYLGGFGLWLVAFSFSTAALFRFTQQVTQRGISNSAWSAFYNVVPRERRAQVLAFNDGVPGQVGTILSGFLLLAAGTLLALDQVFWLGVITAFVCTIVVARHPPTLSRERRCDSLRTGLAEQVLEGGPGSAALARDPAVSDTLDRARSRRPSPGSGADGRRACSAQGTVERAGSGAHPGRRRRPRSRRAGGRPRGARVAGRPADRRHRGDGMPARRRSSGFARRRFGRWRRWASMPRPSMPTRAIDGLAGDPSPAVRAALACLYSSHGPDPSSTRIVAGSARRTGRCGDGSSGSKRSAGWAARSRSSGCADSSTIRRRAIRAAAVATLASRQRHRPRPGRRRLVRALDDDAAGSVRTAAQALSDRDSTPLGLLDVLVQRLEPSAGGGPRRAARSRPGCPRDRHRWTLGRLERATELRRARRDAGRDSETAAARRPEPALAFLLAASSRRREATHDRGLALRPWSSSGHRRPAASSGAASTRTTRRSGRRRSRPSTPSATASSRRRSSGCSKTRRSRCAGSRCRACPAGR